MKIVRFWQGDAVRTGLLVRDGVIDLADALAHDGEVLPAERHACRDTTALAALGERGLAIMRRAMRTGVPMPLSELSLLAPMEPRLLLCSGENYWDHRDEKPVVEGREPEFFLKNPLGVIGHGGAVQLDRRVTSKLDYEVELVAVIGKPGRHIPAERALEHVWGYTIMNDITARDRQVRLRPDGSAAYALGPGKSFDTCAPMGPCIVTADEIADPQSLHLRSYVNGELRQDNNTERMIWSVAQLVAFFSTYVTLGPGVMISTGTPGGTAWGSDAELGARGKGLGVPGQAARYLRPGDEVVCEIEGIGVLSNRVAAAGVPREAEPVRA